ncbi:MAG: type III pantothenate kinase [Lactimicrobium sp.]|jgi:type III pantothenate kinase|uniref:type III pantothenate kinase n=1 Tax=Lactimicrobium sp. TaxID=2563780 RepID=UPI002F351C34
MQGYLLAIDAGNTHVRIGLMDEETIIFSIRLSSLMPRTADEYWLAVRDFLMDSQIAKDEVTGAIISCVVPDHLHALVSCVQKYFHLQPLVVGPGIRTGISVRTDNPREIGADRIVNAAYGHAMYSQGVIVADFGTAVTYDYVSKDGIFAYTIIAPGLDICAQALKNSTAKLPGIALQMPAGILAKNTVAGMQAGVMYSYLGGVEKVIAMMKHALRCDCPVVATGGLGRMIAANTHAIDAYDPDVAFKGMRIIYKLNQK